MSIAAMNWAMAQATGSPSAQCLLYVIADVANEEGRAFPSVAWMAEKSQQSRNTVRRRLRDLEELGLLVRLDRYTKEGRQTSDEIRLQLGARVRRAATETDDREAATRDQEEARESAPAEPGGEGSKLDPRGPTRGRGRGPIVGPHEPYIYPDPPQSPPLPRTSSPGSAEEPRSPEPEPPDNGPDIEAFRAASPVPSTRPHEVEALWTALSAAEREQAITGMRGYAAFVVARDRKAMDPAKFLRQPALWAEFARHAPKPPPKRVFVAEGSAGWAAWNGHLAIFGQPPLAAADCGERGRGALLPAALPPGGEALAHLPPREEWALVRHGSRQWWAWDERVQAWTGRPLERDIVNTGEMEPFRHPVSGAVEQVNVRVAGRWLPWEWPPPRGPARDGDGAGGQRQAAE